MPNTNEARTVTLCWKTKTAAGWRYFPCQFHMQHGDYEVVPGLVMDGGEKRTYPQGKFFLRSYVHGKKVYTPVESCHPHAAVEALRKANEASKLAAVETEPTTEFAAAQRYRETTKKNGVPSLLKDAAAAYALHLESYTPPRLASSSDARIALDEFRKVTGVVYTSKITRADILSFCTALKARGNAGRTVYNKYGRLLAFLRFAKVTVADLRAKADAPTYEEKAIDTYNDGQMESLRAVCDDYMRLAIDMAQQMGLRYQELIHAEWSDLKACMFTVKGHNYKGTSRGYEFKVKDKEQRTVPVNSALCARLQAWKESHPGTVLILGTASDLPNTHLLRQLKRLAKNAGLNCGTCNGCKGKGKECKDWTLHRFRRTYLTTLLRNGVDIVTVSKMAGHSDLESTQRYLKALHAETVLPTVNAIKW